MNADGGTVVLVIEFSIENISNLTLIFEMLNSSSLEFFQLRRYETSVRIVASPPPLLVQPI